MFSSLFSPSKQSNKEEEKEGGSDDNQPPSISDLDSDENKIDDDKKGTTNHPADDESLAASSSPSSSSVMKKVEEEEDNLNNLLLKKSNYDGGSGTVSLLPLLCQSYQKRGLLSSSTNIADMYSIQEEGEKFSSSSSYPSSTKVKFWMEAHSLSCLRQKSCHVVLESVVSDFSPPSEFSQKKNFEPEVIKELIRLFLETGCIWIYEDGTTGQNKGIITEKDCDILVLRKSTNNSKDGMIANLTGNLAKLSVNPSSVMTSSTAISAKEEEEETVVGIQMASAAQLIAAKFNQTTESLGPASWETAGRIAAQTIQQNRQKKQSSVATPVATPPPATKGYGMAAASATYSIAKTAVGGLKSAFHSVLVSYDLADEYDANDGTDAYNDDDAENDTGEGDDDQYDDALRSSSAKLSTSTAKEKTLVIANSDSVWNIRVVVHCCCMVLGHVQNLIESSSSSSNSGRYIVGSDGRELILLDRWGNGVGSFGRMCHEVGASSVSSPTASNFSSAYSCLLSSLDTRSIDLIALVLLASGHATESNDGKVIAIQNGANTNPPTLSDIDVALFQMDKTISALEKRMEKLSSFADNAKISALDAKRNGKASLALLHMKRRKMSLEELDVCSATLLNLESAAASLRRAQSDAQVVKCYETIKSAMSLVRKSEEEGGLGLTSDVVSNTMDEIAEETQELGEISDSLGAMMGRDGEEDIDDEMLEKELQSLEATMMSEEKSEFPDTEKSEFNGPTKEEEESSEKNQEIKLENPVENDNEESKRTLEAL